MCVCVCFFSILLSSQNRTPQQGYTITIPKSAHSKKVLKKKNAKLQNKIRPVNFQFTISDALLIFPMKLALKEDDITAQLDLKEDAFKLNSI